MSLLLALTGGGSSPTSYTFSLDSGSYSISGVDATFLVSRAFSLGVGSYSITGVDATFRLNLNLNLLPGSYSVTGVDLTFDLPSVLPTYQAGGKRKKRKQPSWLVKLLRDLDEDWVTQFVGRVKEQPIDKIDKVIEELPYFDLDTKSIYLAIELIKRIQEKKKKDKKKKEEELLILFMD